MSKECFNETLKLEINEKAFKNCESLEKHFANEFPWSFYPDGFLPVAELLQDRDFPDVICVEGSLDGRKIAYAVCKYLTSEIFFVERIAEYKKLGFASKIMEHILEKMDKDRDIDAVGGPMDEDAKRLLERFSFEPANQITRKGTWRLKRQEPGVQL